MWNSKTLHQPPNLTYKCSNVDVATLKRACLKALTVLKDEQQLHSEAALLSRFLYSMKTKFRSDKGFNILGKVNRSLLQYLSLNLFTIYNNFCECVPDPSDPDQYVPSLQMLQYLLVRTQSFARLWCYIVSNCREAAQFLRARMGLGHNWWAAVVALAITSRIWAYGKYFIVSSCEWFSQLKPFLEILKVNGPPWLPDNYTFPDDLRLWLEEMIPEKDILSENCRVKLESSINRLFAAVSGSNNDDDDDFGDVEILENNSILEEPIENASISRKQIPSSHNVKKYISKQAKARSVYEDIGEHVTRGSMELPSKNTTSFKSLSEEVICVPAITANEQKFEDADGILPKTKATSKGASNYSQCLSGPINLKRKHSMHVENETFPPAIAKDNRKQNLCKSKVQSLTKTSATIPILSNKILQLRTTSDLVEFMEREEKLRGKWKKSCITKNLDKLQWNMLKNVISSYVLKLKKKSCINNDVKYQFVMKKARKEIKVRLQ